MEDTARNLAEAAAEAAQLQPRKKLSQKGRHQEQTEAYTRDLSAKSNDLADFILSQYREEIAAVTRYIGYVLEKLDKLTIVEVLSGYLTTASTELGVAVPLTKAKVVLEATPPAIALTQVQKAELGTELGAGKEVKVPVALKNRTEVEVSLEAKRPIRMKGINIIPPSSAFCVEVPTLLVLFKVRAKGNGVENR